MIESEGQPTAPVWNHSAPQCRSRGFDYVPSFQGDCAKSGWCRFLPTTQLSKVLQTTGELVLEW